MAREGANFRGREKSNPKSSPREYLDRNERTGKGISKHTKSVLNWGKGLYRRRQDVYRGEDSLRMKSPVRGVWRILLQKKAGSTEGRALLGWKGGEDDKFEQNRDRFPKNQKEST